MTIIILIIGGHYWHQIEEEEEEMGQNKRITRNKEKPIWFITP